MEASIEKIDKDVYSIFINGKLIGVFERSEIRHLIETLDKVN